MISFAIVCSRGGVAATAFSTATPPRARALLSKAIISTETARKVSRQGTIASPCSSLFLRTTQRRMMSRKTDHSNNNLSLVIQNSIRSNGVGGGGSNGVGGGSRRIANTAKGSSRRFARQQQRRKKATLAAQSTSTCPIKNIRKGILRYERMSKEVVKFHRDKLNNWLNKPRSLPVPRWINPKHITYRISEIFGHGSFVLVAISYAVDDHLHLRLLAILGSSSMLVFTYFHPHGRTLWLPFHWNCVFVALNAWRVAKVYYNRYWIHQSLSDSLTKIYDDHFHVMSKCEFAKVVRLGTIERKQKGDIIVRQDEDNRYVRLVIQGDCVVDRDGQTTYGLHEGQFISEFGLHAGLGLRGAVTSCCTVSAASDDVELLRWDRTELNRLLEWNKSIERTMKAVMSWDIVSKLKSQRTLLASGTIDDPVRWTKKRREQAVSRYQSILQNVLIHPVYNTSSMKDRLKKYRDIHQITHSDHVSALNDIGWTIEEFESGYKEGHTLDQDKIDIKNFGYKWWFQSWWKAL